MNTKEIISVLYELHKITGFRVSLHGADYSEIAAYPEKKSGFCRTVHAFGQEYRKCVECDKEACRIALEKKDTYIYECRFGLTEAVSPLYNFGTLTGFLMMGQVAQSEGVKEELKNKLSALGIKDDGSADSEIRTVDPDMVSSYVKIMTICAQYLTLSNAIPNNKPTVAQMAKKYIFDNYAKKIGIADICLDVGCSKSTLITAFKRELGLTVNSYLTEFRLKEAEKMLATGEYTVGQVAYECGFSDQSYFSKVFSAKYGMPPSEYGRSKG